MVMRRRTGLMPFAGQSVNTCLFKHIFFADLQNWHGEATRLQAPEKRKAL
jgi:hypothetical protein